MQMSLLIKDKGRNEQKTPNTRAERFLHRMLFKVANEASAALFMARLLAVWILQRSCLLPGLALGLPPLPSLAGRLVPACSRGTSRLEPGKPEPGTGIATRTGKRPGSSDSAELLYGVRGRAPAPVSCPGVTVPAPRPQRPPRGSGGSRSHGGRDAPPSPSLHPLPLPGAAQKPSRNGLATQTDVSFISPAFILGDAGGTGRGAEPPPCSPCPAPRALPASQQPRLAPAVFIPAQGFVCCP